MIKKTKTEQDLLSLEHIVNRDRYGYLQELLEKSLKDALRRYHLSTDDTPENWRDTPLEEVHGRVEELKDAICKGHIAVQVKFTLTKPEKYVCNQ